MGKQKFSYALVHYVKKSPYHKENLLRHPSSVKLQRNKPRAVFPVVVSLSVCQHLILKTFSCFVNWETI